MPYNREQYRDWSIYEGILIAEDLARTDRCHRTGCIADGFAYKFIADPETKQVKVYKLLESDNYSFVGDGEKLKESILFKWGGRENLEKVVMERLYETWGGKAKYEELFILNGRPIMRESSNYDYTCGECGNRVKYKQDRCGNCIRGKMV